MIPNVAQHVHYHHTVIPPKWRDLRLLFGLVQLGANGTQLLFILSVLSRRICFCSFSYPRNNPKLKPPTTSMRQAYNLALFPPNQILKSISAGKFCPGCPEQSDPRIPSKNISTASQSHENKRIPGAKISFQNLQFISPKGAHLNHGSETTNRQIRSGT